MHKIHLSGPEKCGNHALVKVVELLGIPPEWQGLPGTVMSHMGYKELPEGDKHVFIKRHPKNAFLSNCRFHNYPIQSGMLQSKLRNWNGSGPYIDRWARQVGWLTAPNTLVITFEGLISDGGETIRQVADYLDVPFLEDAYAHLPGGTRTWNPVHSDYTTCEAWTDAVESVWTETGGDEIVRAFGYDR